MKKVGHAGTLDPMATGLVIVGLGASTRLLTFVVGLDKEYLATIRLGERTTTDDAEGEIVERADAGLIDGVTDEQIDAGVRDLTGAIEQVPSSVSAIKVNGKRAYALVRAGEEVELKARPVIVSEFEVTERRRTAEHIDLDVRVVCSSGTYIRALARDLGEQLGVGGHLTALRRTRIGPFDIADARTLDDVDAGNDLIGPTTVAEQLFPALHMTEAQAIDLGHGKKIDVAELEGAPIAAIAPDGRLVGLIEARRGQGKSIVNFPTDGLTATAGSAGEDAAQ
jgi:tRNA pseudouridine55 synthase